MRGHKILAKLAGIFLLGSALVGFSPIAAGGDSNILYEMYVNGQKAGIVKHAAHGLAAYDEALEKIEAEFPDKVYIEGAVIFKQQTGVIAQADSDSDLFEGIRKYVDIKTDAYGINIDGETVCHVKTEEEAKQVVEELKKPFADNIGSMENHQLDDIAIQQNITFSPEKIFYAQLVDKDRAVEIITVGEEGAKEYEVKAGDSLWAIARAFDIHVSDIEAANPGITENLQIGQKLNIMAVRSLITVETKEKFTYTEPIPYTKETKNDSSIYEGESKTVQEGRNGEKEIQVYITRENGKEISREIISEKVTKEPVPQIIARGTKKRPAPTPSRSSSGTGSLKRPSDLTPLSRKGAALTPWSTVNTIFTRGSIAKVTHLDTGITFYVYRKGGYNHADVEPLTAADTKLMKQVYGSWSWRRESIIVETNGKKIAASMNGMPHGLYNIKDNNFNGHFCIHFLNSKTHGTNRVDPDHQAALKRVVN